MGDRGHRRVRVRATANPDPIGNLDFFSFFLFFSSGSSSFSSGSSSSSSPPIPPATIFFSTFVSSFSVWNFSTSSIVVFFLLFFFRTHFNNIHSRKICNYKKKKVSEYSKKRKGPARSHHHQFKLFFSVKKKNFEIKRKLIQFRFEIVIISIEFHLSVT